MDGGRARGASSRRLGITSGNIPRGSRGVDLEGKAETQAQWKSHNYNHLMEQPTIFYAIALTLALMDFGGGINYLAGLGLCRLPHRPQPGPVHGQHRRYPLPVFALASLCLLGLTVHAGAADPPRLRDLSAEAGGQLDVGRPAELADRPHPFEPIAAVGQRPGVAGEGRRVAADVGDPRHR